MAVHQRPHFINRQRREKEEEEEEGIYVAPTGRSLADTTISRAIRVCRKVRVSSGVVRMSSSAAEAALDAGTEEMRGIAIHFD